MIARAVEPSAGAARIGPNAVVQIIAALRERHGAAAAAELLDAAGLTRFGAESPSDMVDEDDVTALYGALRARWGREEAGAVAVLAGRKTAAYILACRIPRAAQMLMRVLPKRRAARALLDAIGKHTWTFAGSAAVNITVGRPARIALVGCPICRGSADSAALCSYYAASFEALFRELVSAQAAVVEIACEGAGAETCVFEFRY